MSDEFTPGPWFMSQPHSTIYIEARLRGSVVQEVAAIGPTETPSQSEANARLMAQSPDMLDDLREAAATLRRYEVSHRAKNTEDSAAKAEVNAALATRFEATIAKATGTTP